MRILAIDTSCGAASVAVVEGGRAGPLAVISRPMARGHADALPPMVEEAMRGVEGGFPSLARIAVATGPGSFTGIRIGLAMARAMGMALAIPVVGVSTWPPSPRRYSASKGPKSSPRQSMLVTARSIFSCSRRPAVRWGRLVAIRSGNVCARLAPGPPGSPATPPRLSPAKPSAPDCLTTSTPREPRRTLSPSRGWVSPLTPRKAPRAPFT